MKYIRIIILFFLIASCKNGGDPVEPASPQDYDLQLKVLCYNLRFGELASLEELAAFIKEQNPDIVALQEVDVRTNRTAAPHQNGKDFITELGFRTGMLTAYGKTIPYMGGYYGIGILSKYPLASIQRIYLPHPENAREQRAVLVADVEYRQNQYFTFACTHLDHSVTDVRQLQVNRLNEILHAKPHPVIVAGDFNARPNSKEISEGMSNWKIVTKMEPTSPANAPSSQIDYIFCYPQNKWDAIEATTYRVQLSDHLPISAVVGLKK